MITRCLILFFCLCACHFSNSQDLEGKQVCWKATNGHSGISYTVIIACKNDSIHIVYKLRDSISAQFDSDPNIIACRAGFSAIKPIDLRNDTVKSLLNRLVLVQEQYSYYTVDSLKLAVHDNPEYSAMLSRLFATSVDSLENRSSTKNWLILHGTSISMSLIEHNAVKNVDVYAPREVSHPLLYSFIKSTLDLYRNNNNGDLLTRRRTGGY